MHDYLTLYYRIILILLLLLFFYNEFQTLK